MQGMSRGVVVALWAATAAAAFGIGWVTPPPHTALAPGELATPIRLALGEGDPLERLRRTASLLERLGPEDLPEVTALYERMQPLIDACELGSFYAAWARFDPARALEHALAWPRFELQLERERGVRTAIEGWARLDPDAAREVAEKTAAIHPRLRQQVWTGLVRGWAHSGRDREGLAVFLADLRPMQHRDGALGVAAEAFVRGGGAEAALGWADPILRDESFDPEFKRSVFASTARAAARWDAERAAAWAVEHRDAEYAEEGPLIVAEHFGPWDGPAAMAWLAGYPAGKPRDQAVREAFVQWSGVDGVGAEAWLDSESPTAFHEPALEVRAEQLAVRRPEDALGWCQRIQDAARRQSCLESTARSWYAHDAVAAETWLQQSPLDEEARSGIRRAGKPRRLPDQRRRAIRGRPR
jgi:hypothetical protein